MKGPFGINLVFIIDKLCNIDVGLDWSWLSYGVELETAIIEIIELIIKQLGRSKYIYIPDGYYGTFKRIEENMNFTSIDKIEKFLIKNLIYPKPLSEIRNSKPDLPGYDDNGFFVKSLMK